MRDLTPALNGRHLYRQDSQRRQARRLAGDATD